MLSCKNLLLDFSIRLEGDRWTYTIAVVERVIVSVNGLTGTSQWQNSHLLVPRPISLQQISTWTRILARQIWNCPGRSSLRYPSLESIELCASLNQLYLYQTVYGQRLERPRGWGSREFPVSLAYGSPLRVERIPRRCRADGVGGFEDYGSFEVQPILFQWRAYWKCTTGSHYYYNIATKWRIIWWVHNKERRE